ncbi:hypothetical protein AKJ64_03655 [candidate division MSBL1 archaeon SCGC-AAA259E17]|uniref:Transposase IS66 zinc-finger binding domain-containing protein n=1 Tax=candidate division MSBL1 archaeon SCGC-AAA259E17 TaxID=1698263 RepID=A0A133UDJ0_9EURY|nr:hypothetical protein AKJ64_03655 [candidate division MSBL1 archaeon SCGC-AAA259E17]
MRENKSAQNLNVEIELLREENRKLKQENYLLRRENEELRQTVRELEKAKKELEEELAEEKKPDIKPRQREEERKKSGRKKNHKGESREKPDQVDEEVSLDPLQVCPDCGGEVSEPQEWRERYREEIVLPQYRVHTGFDDTLVALSSLLFSVPFQVVQTTPTRPELAID